jgi:hypothetical protein
MTADAQSAKWQESISALGWLSASITLDLRNPLSAICAGLKREDMVTRQRRK